MYSHFGLHASFTCQEVKIRPWKYRGAVALFIGIWFTDTESPEGKETMEKWSRLKFWILTADSIKKGVFLIDFPLKLVPENSWCSGSATFLKEYTHVFVCAWKWWDSIISMAEDACKNIEFWRSTLCGITKGTVPQQRQVHPFKCPIKLLQSIRLFRELKQLFGGDCKQKAK